MEGLSPGTTLSRYRIVSKIGAGGMGEVYLAQDTKLDRKVALKILPEHLGIDSERMRRFVQEAKAASALNHPTSSRSTKLAKPITSTSSPPNTLTAKQYIPE